MTSELKVEQRADQAAWEAWPDSCDAPQREAFQAGYLAASRDHMTSASEDEVERVDADVMIGDFIARWDEAADGVCMDADTAQALAREFKRMRELIYLPGVWRCAKCNFRLIQSNLNALDGTITARDEPGEKCRNDGSPMWRVTYRDDIAEAYDRWEEQVNRAVEAERKLAALRARAAMDGQ
jgi:hypothetical protein